MGFTMTDFVVTLGAGLGVAVLLWPRSNPARVPVNNLRAIPSRASVSPSRQFGRWLLNRWRKMPWFRRAIEAKVASALPETIDVLSAVLGAGGTPIQAIEMLADRGPEVIHDPTIKVLTRRNAGAGLAESLELLVAELGSDYRPTVRALVATERDGAPVATLMERLASEARSARRAHSEARARRLPVLLMGPLVLCFLPAVVVGAIVPLLMVSLSDLSF